MNFYKINSYAKINLSLNVIKRLSNKFHEIESLVTFIRYFDEISIREIKNKEHKVYFEGKFSKGIGKNNSLSKLLKLLEKEKLLKNKNFEIRVKKNIPQKSGMGGGSMNAANILKYLIKKKIFKISKKKSLELASKIDSDTILGMEKKNSVLFKNGKIKRLNNCLNFHVLIVKPDVNCSTKLIYSRVNKYSKCQYKDNNKSFFKKDYLVNSSNDLEKVVFRLYPKIKNLKIFISTLPNILFTRMTGSGSAIVGYFKSKKTANIASKIFRRKYNNYWYIISKTI